MISCGMWFRELLCYRSNLNFICTTVTFQIDRHLWSVIPSSAIIFIGEYVTCTQRKGSWARAASHFHLIRLVSLYSIKNKPDVGLHGRDGLSVHFAFGWGLLQKEGGSKKCAGPKHFRSASSFLGEFHHYNRGLGNRVIGRARMGGFFFNVVRP